MILCIDGSNIRQGGGITHLAELLSHIDPFVFGFTKVVLFGNIRLLDSIDDRVWLVKVNCPMLEKSLFFRIWWQFYYLNKLIKIYKCNILFSPGGIIFNKIIPTITMSQNLLPFDWKEIFLYINSLNFIRLLLLRIAQQLSFKKSNGIIFLTKYSQDLVLEKIGYTHADSIIIPHGISRIFNDEFPRFIAKNYSSLNPIKILYVSIISKYKNHCILVEAVAQLRSKGIPILLDLVGPHGDASHSLKSAINKFDPNGNFVRHLGEVSYVDLSQFYSKADIGIFASSCEAFGMILLEKMASGLPIACSNRSSMFETLGDAGLYFDPEDPVDIASCLLKLIESPQLRAELSQRAKLRASSYSWEACSQATFGFLNSFSEQAKDIMHINLSSAGISFHDSIAGRWSSSYLNGGFKKRRLFFQTLLHKSVTSGEFWADFGCGSGVLTKLLLENGAQVLAIDGSSNMLNQASYNLQEFSGPSVSFLNADIQSASVLEDNMFDGILVSSVFEYLNFPNLALSELARTLRPGGKLLMTIPPKRSHVRRLQKILRLSAKFFGFNLFEYLDYSIFEVNPDEVKSWLGNSNFELRNISHFDPFISSKLTHMLTPSLLVIEAVKN